MGCAMTPWHSSRKPYLNHRSLALRGFASTRSRNAFHTQHYRGKTLAIADAIGVDSTHASTETSRKLFLVRIQVQPIGLRIFFGSRRGPRDSAAAKLGDGGSRMHHSLGRAHHGQSEINSRLCSIGQFDPNDWNLPKPSGCAGKHIVVTWEDSNDMKHS